MERDWWKKGLAEMLGGFGLVTVGAGSVLAASLTGQNVILFAAFGHTLCNYAALIRHAHVETA